MAKRRNRKASPRRFRREPPSNVSTPPNEVQERSSKCSYTDPYMDNLVNDLSATLGEFLTTVERYLDIEIGTHDLSNAGNLLLLFEQEMLEQQKDPNPNEGTSLRTLRAKSCATRMAQASADSTDYAGELRAIARKEVNVSYEKVVMHYLYLAERCPHLEQQIEIAMSVNNSLQLSVSELIREKETLTFDLRKSQASEASLTRQLLLLRDVVMTLFEQCKTQHARVIELVRESALLYEQKNLLTQHIEDMKSIVDMAEPLSRENASLKKTLADIRQELVECKAKLTEKESRSSSINSQDTVYLSVSDGFEPPRAIFLPGVAAPIGAEQAASVENTVWIPGPDSKFKRVAIPEQQIDDDEKKTEVEEEREPKREGHRGPGGDRPSVVGEPDVVPKANGDRMVTVGGEESDTDSVVMHDDEPKVITMPPGLPKPSNASTVDDDEARPRPRRVRFAEEPVVVSLSEKSGVERAPSSVVRFQPVTESPPRRYYGAFSLMNHQHLERLQQNGGHVHSPRVADEEKKQQREPVESSPIPVEVGPETTDDRTTADKAAQVNIQALWSERRQALSISVHNQVDVASSAHLIEEIDTLFKRISDLERTLEATRRENEEMAEMLEKKQWLEGLLVESRGPTPDSVKKEEQEVSMTNEGIETLSDSPSQGTVVEVAPALDSDDDVSELDSDDDRSTIVAAEVSQLQSDYDKLAKLMHELDLGEWHAPNDRQPDEPKSSSQSPVEVRSETSDHHPKPDDDHSASAIYPTDVVAEESASVHQVVRPAFAPAATIICHESSQTPVEIRPETTGNHPPSPEQRVSSICRPDVLEESSSVLSVVTPTAAIICHESPPILTGVRPETTGNHPQSVEDHPESTIPDVVVEESAPVNPVFRPVAAPTDANSCHESSSKPAGIRPTICAARPRGRTTFQFSTTRRPQKTRQSSSFSFSRRHTESTVNASPPPLSVSVSEAPPMGGTMMGGAPKGGATPVLSTTSVATAVPLSPLPGWSSSDEEIVPPQEATVHQPNMAEMEKVAEKENVAQTGRSSRPPFTFSNRVATCVRVKEQTNDGSGDCPVRPQTPTWIPADHWPSPARTYGVFSTDRSRLPSLLGLQVPTRAAEVPKPPGSQSSCSSVTVVEDTLPSPTNIARLTAFLSG